MKILLLFLLFFIFLLFNNCSNRKDSIDFKCFEDVNKNRSALIDAAYNKNINLAKNILKCELNFNEVLKRHICYGLGMRICEKNYVLIQSIIFSGNFEILSLVINKIKTDFVFDDYCNGERVKTTILSKLFKDIIYEKKYKKHIDKILNYLILNNKINFNQEYCISEGVFSSKSYLLIDLIILRNVWKYDYFHLIKKVINESNINLFGTESPKDYDFNKTYTELDFTKKTPLDYAIEYKDNEIIKLLKEKGGKTFKELNFKLTKTELIDIALNEFELNKSDFDKITLNYYKNYNDFIVENCNNERCKKTFDEYYKHRFDKYIDFYVATYNKNINWNFRFYTGVQKDGFSIIINDDGEILEKKTPFLNGRFLINESEYKQDLTELIKEEAKNNKYDYFLNYLDLNCYSNSIEINKNICKNYGKYIDDCKSLYKKYQNVCFAKLDYFYILIDNKNKVVINSWEIK